MSRVDAGVVSDRERAGSELSVAVHGSVSVEYRELAEAIALVRGARRNIEDDPEMAFRRLDELERLLEDLLARLEEHRS
jgi:hypothetical protein